MKSLLAIGSVFLFFGCGILSFIFGLPDRYIKRDIETQELAGEWKMTPESEAELNKFRETFPDWPDFAPFKTIQLNSDKTCRVKLEIQWLPNYENSPSGIPPEDIPNDVLTNNILACSWKITKTSGFSDSGNKEVRDIEILISYPNNYDRTYSLFIYEENNALILWTFIGDPDDFVPQDFLKSQS
jgi:hypothetical protein